MRTWVATYDVSSDRERSRLAALLGARGRRVLYSVFEVESGDRDMDRLVDQAGDGLLTGGGDHLLVVPLCDRCRRWSAGDDLEAGPRVRLVWRP